MDKPDHVQMVGENFSFSLIDDERPLTEHVHLAVYHPGYYGAFVLDPDGHNVEVVNHNR